MRVVKKYGGSSVATPEKIKKIAESLVMNKKAEDEVVVVVSAMGKTTDNLLKLAKEVSDTPNIRELDALLSIGEQQSIALLSMGIEGFGGKAISLTGSQAGIKTGGIHTKNKIESIDSKKIEEELKKGNIVIVAGFQGVNQLGDITTLGRGGSDTSAVALAASLGAECEIYTDVDGIYSVDPRVYKDARKLGKISYEEMMEMANLGAGIMETRAVEIGKKYGVRIYVGETLGSETGSYICDSSEIIEKKAVTGISINNNVLMINIEKFSNYPKNLSLLFNTLAKNGVNIDMISQNDVKSEFGSIAFTCPGTDKDFLNKSFKDLESVFPMMEPEFREGVSKISLVGIGMISNFGVAAKVFQSLADTNISFHQCTTSEISVSLIIEKSNVERAVESLAKKFSV